MMTLAQFLATHELPNAIVIPGRGRTPVERGGAASSWARTQSIKPAGGSEAARLPRGFWTPVGHGKKK
jgi:hypothetical protein